MVENNSHTASARATAHSRKQCETVNANGLAQRGLHIRHTKRRWPDLYQAAVLKHEPLGGGQTRTRPHRMGLVNLVVEGAAPSDDELQKIVDRLLFEWQQDGPGPVRLELSLGHGSSARKFFAETPDYQSALKAELPDHRLVGVFRAILRLPGRLLVLCRRMIGR